MALKDVKQGNVVKELIIGSASVRFCDDCCRNKTKEEIEVILEKIGEIYVNDYRHIEYMKQNRGKNP